ncbi:pre-mRNA-splicing factor ATP-dependent RNA helicase prp16 [Coccidioides immitis RMSCC 3703]|uniref:RNA helicase n=1 Tax=Coccidioides immitis RMSCC 3703 TaxID=454286 RepID=A0A0J8QK47_COCIT|nr:pre-mRNA-splicing factor ATP-dependent RNA helicase prp16 [Coccidioides immitis RMSCC 3703]
MALESEKASKSRDPALYPKKIKKRKWDDSVDGFGKGNHSAKRVILQGDGNQPNSTSTGNQPGDQGRSSTKNSQRGISKPSLNVGEKGKRHQSLKEKAKVLFEVRKRLPIFAHAEEIRQHLRRTDVMLLIGETGSGKSTQVPQFLVDEEWCCAKTVKVRSPSPSGGKRTKVEVGGCVAITQPRRVAAVSLARRVAEEMGTPLGNSSPASKVGYSVRFDTSTSPSTKVKFLTDGMLLQEMLSDPWLTKYSVVVVDEVHERGVNVDLLLGFLRHLVSGTKEGRGGVPLKVVVMSATADMESLLAFFKEGFIRGSGDGVARDNDTNGGNGSSDAELNGDYGDTPAETVKRVHMEPAPVPDFVDAALKTIFQIHYKEPLPGDILVFLTGQETVESLEYMVNDYAHGMDPALPKVLVVPLFAALPQAAQQRVFLPTPPRKRKIILATNIAETSVTVPGVRYVIDCGKAKMKQFRTRLGLDSLLVKPISNAIGRQTAKRQLTDPLAQLVRAPADHGENCLRDVIDIISCLSVENIFLGTTSEEKKEEAEKARRDLYRREGDHLTMLVTVRAYSAENSDRKAWAERHMVSHRAMQAVMDVRKQLITQCKQAKLFDAKQGGDEEARNLSINPVPGDSYDPVLILRSFLAGFACNTARLFPDGSYRTIVGNQTVAIHPSSVLFGRKVEAIMYNEYVFTNRSYARGVSAVQMNWIGEALASS